MASSKVESVSDADFDEKMAGAKGLVLVKFWAEWCTPCKKLAPTIEELADEYEGKVTVFSMDCDANPRTPQRFSIKGIPTCVLFRDSKTVGQLTGKYPKEAYTDMFNKFTRENGNLVCKSP